MTPSTKESVWLGALRRSRGKQAGSGQEDQAGCGSCLLQRIYEVAAQPDSVKLEVLTGALSDQHGRRATACVQVGSKFAEIRNIVYARYRVLGRYPLGLGWLTCFALETFRRNSREKAPELRPHNGQDLMTLSASTSAHAQDVGTLYMYVSWPAMAMPGWHCQQATEAAAVREGSAVSHVSGVGAHIRCWQQPVVDLARSPIRRAPICPLPGFA
ncbi:hypothetical protein PF003_g31552 [Phytophthora fragariae]|nr:hypothetical protein PF003_g31552 [Phytophthora fragariae]